MAQPPDDHACVTTTKSKAAAAASIGAGLAGRKRAELLAAVRSCFARAEAWLQAGKYVGALVSGLPRRNGWTIAEHAGDRSPDRTQRLLNRASWDTFAAMSQVRRFAVAGLEEAARRAGRRGGLVIGALDETGQEKAGAATAGVKRQYLGCAGRVANGINTVHLSYVREKTGHALAGARQWIPREHIEDPARSLVTGLPLDLEFRTKGQLALDICTDAYQDGLRFDFTCGDEVYGTCTELREFFEERGQAYVLRVASTFTLTLAAGTKLTCAQAVIRLLKDNRRWEIRSAGKGSKARGAAADQDAADPRRRAALARGGRFRAREGLLRAGPVPGPALHRDRPPRRAGHGRPGNLRRHRRAAQRPHRHSGAPARPG
jgi:SRSO17 transposase